MTRERSDADLGAILEVWMDAVAPAAAPERVLEEAFGRTVTTRQARAYPWHRLARRGRSARGSVRLGLVGLAAVLMLSLGVGLLGGGSGVGPGPSASPSPTASASPSARAMVPVIPEASVAVVGPQVLATDGQVVWVLTATGAVIRIDPATNTAGAGTQLGATTDLSDGLAVDENGVWATDSDNRTLYRVDPATATVVARILAGFAPLGVLATGSAIWVADTHGGAVLRIDPATNTVVATITVGPFGNSGPNWLASGLGSIWVGIPNASTVVRIDPITNAIQAMIAMPDNVPSCGGFAFTDGAVWTPSCDGHPIIARIDPATNTVVATVSPGGVAFTPVVIDGAPWVSLDTNPNVPGSIARVASTTNTVDLELSPGTDFGGGEDMVIAGGSVWVIDEGHDRVLRLPLADFPPG